MAADTAAENGGPLARGLRLPDAWHDRGAWRVLEVGAATASNFLLLWRAWRADSRRPRMLHHVVLGAQALVVQPTAGDHGSSRHLSSLAEQLRNQCWGLTPGTHRLAFESGRVLLTLAIGPVDALLREQRFEADSIWLGDGATAGHPEAHGDRYWLKALARCCRRGTRVAARTALSQRVRQSFAQGGFTVEQAVIGRDAPASQDAGFAAVFDPAWQPRARRDAMAAPAGAFPCGPAPAIVIGAGLAGAAVAASLARRGQRVRVLDAAPQPAAGASGLPAGLFAPHVSVDDSVLSQLTRAGIRCTLQFARERLEDGADWHMSGVLERRAADSARAPPGCDWSEPASPECRAAAGMNGATPALWHRRAGWIRPAALVRALLADPLIEFCGAARVDRLAAGQRGWRVLDARGQLLGAETPLVVLAAGHDSRALAPGRALPLQPVAGQLSWRSLARQPDAVPGRLPPFPVNGDGSLLPQVALSTGPGWIAGATYRRGAAAGDLGERGADHAENLARLNELLPQAAQRLGSAFARNDVRAWTGVRCVTPDRLPVVGALDGDRATAPTLWISGALGSRGLTFALLCAELLAAKLAAEPPPLAPRLANALDVRRFGQGRIAPDAAGRQAE